MRPAILLLLLAAACARDDGRWPSLAPRPAELRGLNSLRDQTAAPVRSQAPVDAGPVALALAGIERDLAAARQSLAIERAASIGALTAARNAATTSDATGAAELQLTRLEALIARFEALAERSAAVGRDAGRTANTPALSAAAARVQGEIDSDRASLSRLADQMRAALAR